ncbi:MAG: hypothetical protein BWY72_02304 [Bacteroidetes bacterium ADurb.Bin416]|nr:MAG: hypothetical protein BWY72_02304 [Bacteroidetes bacterium ADurb.Bin416]
MIDGSIGLDKGLDTQIAAGSTTPTVSHVTAQATTLGTDDAGRHGGGQVHGITHGQDPLAHLEVVGVTESDGWQVFGINLKQGDVGAGVGTNDLGGVFFLVVGRDGNFIGPLYHVVVGDDVTVRGDDDS